LTDFTAPPLGRPPREAALHQPLHQRTPQGSGPPPRAFASSQQHRPAACCSPAELWALSSVSVTTDAQQLETLAERSSGFSITWVSSGGIPSPRNVRLGASHHRYGASDLQRVEGRQQCLSSGAALNRLRRCHPERPPCRRSPMAARQRLARSRPEEAPDRSALAVPRPVEQAAMARSAQAFSRSWAEPSPSRNNPGAATSSRRSPPSSPAQGKKLSGTSDRHDRAAAQQNVQAGRLVLNRQFSVPGEPT